MRNQSPQRTFFFSRLQTLPATAKAPQFRKLTLWSYSEIVLYSFFLHQFIDRRGRRKCPKMEKADFFLMSKHLKTRNPNQCRIFHSKMLKVQSSLPDLLQFFRQSIEEYPSFYQQYKENLSSQESTLHFPNSEQPIFGEASGQLGEYNQLESDNGMRVIDDFNESLVFSYNLPPYLFKFDGLEGSSDSLHHSWLNDL